MTPTQRLEKLNRYEIDVLRIVAGEDVPGWTWGAAMGVCVEYLRGAGLIAGSTKYEPTPEGHAVLAAWRARQSTNA